jgi:predicted  nucleic acid-binding Zn-ribbon protein
VLSSYNELRDEITSLVTRLEEVDHSIKRLEGEMAELKLTPKKLGPRIEQCKRKIQAIQSEIDSEVNELRKKMQSVAALQ